MQKHRALGLVCALACLALLQCARVEAGVLSPARQPIQRSRKVHLLRPELRVRLKPETQANIDSLVRYGDPVLTGSAVLIGSWQGKRGRVRGLVLTNNHVIDEGYSAESTLTFNDGTQAKNSRVVARNRFLDYALLEVELPAGAQVQPAHAVYGVPVRGTPVYSMGSDTSMTTYPPETFIGGGPRVRAQLAEELARSGLDYYPVISRGTIDSPELDYGSNKEGKRKYLLFSDLASAPGSSGGPVFDATSHALVGIHVQGHHDATTSTAGMSSIDSVLHDLGKQLSRGRIPARHQDLVGALLDETIPQSELGGVR